MENFRTRLRQVWSWLQTDAGLLLSIMLFLPLGLILVARNERFTVKFKKGFIGIGTLIILFILFTWTGHMNLTNQFERVSAQSKQTTSKLSDTNQAYGDLKDEYEAYQEKMHPYEKLAKAEGKKRQADAAAAEKVSRLIENLPLTYSLSIDNKAKVEEARKAFNDLTKPQQELVDESKLKELEAKLTELEKKAENEAAEAKKREEEQAAAAKRQAEEEAKGYDTGITYDQLARTPDDYEGKKVKFYGKAVQIMEDGNRTQARIAVNDDYDNMILCEWSSLTVSSRVLEDDMITVSGTSEGLITYESTMGGDITIPSMSVAKIDR